MNQPSIIARVAKQLFRSAGLEVQRFRSANTEDAAIVSLLRSVQPDVVLDVGANEGQYARSLRTLNYQGPIISFEPLREVHARLQARATTDRNWTVAPRTALGCEPGEIGIHVAQNLASSSLLPMKDIHLSAAPESAYVGVQSTPVRRLDDPLLLPLFAGKERLFLKVDTQGYERAVLEGATGILPRVVGMQLELSLVELYAGAPSLSEMLDYTFSLGFEPFTLVPGFKNRTSGRLYQLDGFFIRKEVN